MVPINPTGTLAQYDPINWVSESVADGILVGLERARRLGLTVVDTNPRVADCARPLVAPVEVEEARPAQYRDRFPQNGRLGVGEAVHDKHIRRGVIHVVLNALAVECL